MSCGCTSNYTCSMCLCTDGINKANYREYIEPVDTGEPVEPEEEECGPTDEDKAEIRKSANEMIFILQCLLSDEKKRRTRDETAQLEVLENHAFWILSKVNNV